MRIAIVFKNKITGKDNYLSTDNSLSLRLDRAMKFGNLCEAHEYYILRYPKLKAHSNIYGWKKQLGVNVDKPFFIEIEQEG